VSRIWEFCGFCVEGTIGSEYQMLTSC
jgi:aerobic-type carbon monoxide dehydrogenase small subunit (CoxS/CutS family)